MSKVTVYGASDDLIEIEGDIQDEFYAFNDEPNYLCFSDGTVLSVEYDENGMWRINRLHLGNATVYEKHEAMDSDKDYSDRVTLISDLLTWVAHGKSMTYKKP